MFNKLRIPVLLIVAALLAGCGVVSITGSGNVVTQEEAITGFDRLDVSQGFQVDVRQGDTFSVVIRVDDNLVDRLDTGTGANCRVQIYNGTQPADPDVATGTQTKLAEIDMGTPVVMSAAATGTGGDANYATVTASATGDNAVKHELHVGGHIGIGIFVNRDFWK